MTRSNQLRLETPDGSGQAVHPDVVFAADGFLGYRYWMACTPYPFGNDREENPILRVSQDGLDWQPLPGAPDPLAAAPAATSRHHADTDLVLAGDELHLFYITTSRVVAETAFYLIRSRDGRAWTPPECIYEGPWGVSPAVVLDRDGQWRMWYVWRDALVNAQTSQLLLRVGEAPQRFGPARTCALEIPGHVVWHLDVLASGRGYEALVTAFPQGTDSSRCLLFHAFSRDGLNFELTSRSPVHRPRWLRWDNRQIYRSTFLKVEGDRYRVWYSAASWAKRWGIGVLEGPLGGLVPVAPRSPGKVVPWAVKLREDLLAFLKYQLAVRWPGAMRLIRSIRRRPGRT